MWEVLERLMASTYMPHGHCYLWEPGLVWLHVVADTVIGIAYVSISVTLVYLVRKIRVPFHWVFLAFGAFIFACGGTHVMEVWNVWEARYWLAGAVKGVTAVASIATAAWLFPLFPKVEDLARSTRLAEERRMELETAHQELERLYSRVTELDELKTHFFANISHELRTPLELILGPIDRLLTAPDLPSEFRQPLQLVKRNARTLLKHVNDLLDLSKLEAGKMVLHKEDIDLAALLRRTASNFKGVAEQRQTTFTVEVTDSVPLRADVEKITRVLLNLLSNSFKFTPFGGVIRCKVWPENEQAVVTVEDSGPGIPTSLREVIFERFRQAEAGPSRAHGGTGLGLAIAKEFVELHGGRIFAGESPLGGALFQMELPAAKEETIDHITEVPERSGDLAQQLVEEIAPEAAVADTFTEDERQPARGERPLVLVVEDNRDMSDSSGSCCRNTW
ncbi:MAG: HAMP domain-containing histidine kinase [Acidobacteria bacterium]|nr:HAMP domain-containing histidine kinase [Acidobacteriota bacterium]